MRRVMIIGGPGSGKSTFARKLGRRLDLPVVHLDQIYWKPGWVLREDAEVVDRLEALYAEEAWVIEGNYPATWDLRLERSDTLVVLDLPTWLRLWRVCLRTWKTYGQARPDLAPGCPERVSFEFLWFVLAYGYERRGIALDLCADAPGHVRRHHLRGTAAIDGFLSDIGSS